MRAPVVTYAEGRLLEERAAADLAAGGPESLLVITHPPVITLGRMADAGNVIATGEALAARGVEVVRTTRGGEATWHGPGQVVVYPVMDLERRRIGPRVYVERLLAAVLSSIRSFGIDAFTIEGIVGVFARAAGGRPAKVAALGVSVSRGITGHGVAVNVCADLSWYDLIVPCGRRDYGVTSMHDLLPAPPPIEPVADALVLAIREALGADPRILP